MATGNDGGSNERFSARLQEKFYPKDNEGKSCSMIKNTWNKSLTFGKWELPFEVKFREKILENNLEFPETFE